MVGSQLGPQCGKYRDWKYYHNWSKVRGRHAPIVSLAYSGRETGLIACADYVGKIALVDAAELYCAAVLQEMSGLLPSCNLHFLVDATTGDLLLASTGYADSSDGAITLLNVEQAQGSGMDACYLYCSFPCGLWPVTQVYRASRILAGKSSPWLHGPGRVFYA